MAAALASLSLPLLAPASSAADPVFEIDGPPGGANFVVNTVGNLDWESVLDGPVANDNVPAETTVFKTSSKENSAVSTWRDGNDAAPPKTDTKELYEWSRLNSDEEIEFYFGWERDKPNGTLFYTLELNAKANVPGVGGGTDFTVPNRTAGDHRFSLKDQGGGIIALVQIDEWTGTAWDCTDGAAAGCDGPIAPGAFLGSVNLVPASWPASWAGAPHTAPADTFVETGFNLTELIGLEPGCPGLTGFLNFRSSTGSTSSSTGENLKDYIKPLRIDGPNDCRDDLTVSKTASATFTRTVNWGITKGNDATYNLFAGQSVNHPYTVGLTRTSTDSLWMVTGNITVTNPNDVAITGVALTDTVNTGGTCVVTNGTGLSVPANDSLTRAYTCTWAAAPSATNGTNTATATWDATANQTPTGTASGTAGFGFTNPTVVNESVNISDEGSGDPSGLVSGSDSQDFGPFTAAGTAASYSRTFNCPTAASAYTNGSFTYTYVNVATIDETGANDNATVVVNCSRALASKTAGGTYDERHTWDVTKSVAPASQHAFAGATAPYEWTVGVAETVTDGNFLVAGTLTVVNPSSASAMTATLADQLNDGTVGVIQSCTGGTWTANTSTLVIPVGGTATCPYRAEPTDRTATTNTLTVTVNGQTTTASDPIEWVANPIDASVTLDDDQNPAFPLSISDSGEWKYPDSETCSTDSTRYTNGVYTITDPNTATIKRGTTVLDSASATATVICHAPVVTKTAVETFTRGWEWVIVKDFDAQYDLNAGESVTHGYRIKVTPSSIDDDWRVTGEITIANSHPTAAMVLDGVTDSAGGVSAPVTCPSLSVPAGGTRVCTYDSGAQDSPGTNPFGATNTATATFASVGWTGSAPIVFPATPTAELDPVIHVDDDNLTGEDFTANRSETTFTYDRDFTCPSDPASYTNGIHEIHHVNTATIVETNDSDTATVDVTCHAPPAGKTLLIIDEDSIDNGIHYARGADRITPGGPLFFTEPEVNDDKPSYTQRDVLRFFAQNEGQTITVKTGQTGDEGWFAPNCIPAKWISGGSNSCLSGTDRDTAIDNYFGIGPVPAQNRLDKIPAVMPLRALGLNSLVGHDVCAVVYDSDISINYDSTSLPYTSGNLQGATLGVVAFHVNETTTLDGFSGSTLPQVTLTINDAADCGAWELFNAPVPTSSSVPNDRVAPGSPDGYRALRTRPLEELFY